MKKSNRTNKKKVSSVIEQLVPLHKLETISSRDLDDVVGGWYGGTGGWQASK